jgi:hypothetical protein
MMSNKRDNYSLTPGQRKMEHAAWKDRFLSQLSRACDFG